MKLGAEKARKLFGAFDKDHNNTVDFVEFCHVIFPDIDEHELLEVYIYIYIYTYIYIYRARKRDRER